MSQTNLQPNTQEFQIALTKIIEYLAQRSLKNKENEWKSQCYKAITNHVRLGGKVSFNKIPKEFIKSMEENLEKANIHNAVIYDAGGNPMIMVKESDADAFYAVQCETFSLSTQFSKELTEASILQSMKHKGSKELTTISVEDPQMGETMKHKLHQCGIVYATHTKLDGSEELLVQTNSKFRQDGKDLVKYEMEHALIQCGIDDVFKKYAPDFLETRLKNNAYDLAVENKFIDMVKKGKEAVLLSRGSKRPSVYIESTKDGVYLRTYNEKTHDYDAKKFDGISRDTDPKDIKAILSYNMENIDDMVIVNKQNFEDFVASKFDMSILRNAVGNQERSEWKGSSQKMNSFIKKEVRPVLDEINKYATQIAATDVENTTIEAKYQAKKRIVIDILENPKKYSDVETLGKLSGFTSKDYDDGKGFSISLDDKLEMLSNFGEHVDNTAENDKYECHINSHAKVSEIEKETAALFKIKAAEIDKDPDPIIE